MPFIGCASTCVGSETGTKIGTMIYTFLYWLKYNNCLLATFKLVYHAFFYRFRCDERAIRWHSGPTTSAESTTTQTDCVEATSVDSWLSNISDG